MSIRHRAASAVLIALVLAIPAAPAGAQSPRPSAVTAPAPPPPAAAAAPADTAAAPADTAAAAAVPLQPFLVIFSLGPNWQPDKPPGEQAAFREHGQNLKRLRDAGRITLGARYSDKGMIVLAAAGPEQARAELEADPGVRAGIFTFEAHPLMTFYDGCLTRPGQ